MSKVTSKFQVTVPKAIAERFNIKPGDQIEWEPAGDGIRVVPASRRRRPKAARQERLRLFDKATERQQRRQATLDSELLKASARSGRGCEREDLYGRGSPR